jgi:hypothetical protein
VLREGRQRLRHVLTIVDGQPMTTLPDEPPAPWINVTDFQHELARQGLP